MGKMVVHGVIHSFRADSSDHVYLDKALPVFNIDGMKNQEMTDGNGVGQFEHPDYAVNGTEYACYWRLGDILNYLRTLFTDSLYNHLLTTPFLNWPEVTGDQWHFLNVEDAKEQIVMNLPLGGMTLAQAIDVIVRKAGKEWSCNWNSNSSIYDLEIFSVQDGIGEQVSLDRGGIGTTLGSTPPAVIDGVVSYDWTGAASSMKIFTKPDEWEVSVAYNPEGLLKDPVELTGYPHNIEPAWDRTKELDYKLTEIAGYEDAVSVFGNVFTRWKFSDGNEWTDAFGGSGVTPNTRTGPHEMLRTLLTKDSDGSPMMGRVYRYKNGNLDPQPETVALKVNGDGTFSITGYSRLDLPIPGTQSNPRYPRWLCSGVEFDAIGTANTSNSNWVPRPFVLTIAVQADERYMGTAKDEALEGVWPEMEFSPDPIQDANAIRFAALHTVDASDVPTEDNPVTSKTVNTDAPWYLHDITSTTEQAAEKALRELSRPIVAGELHLPNPNWSLRPGVQVTTISGGGTPSLPTLQVYGVVSKVMVTGMAEGQLMQTVTLGV
jgi:hypothetical protein